ncbi:golgin subfamily A member 6-like protein 2 [Camponotus floridanus]|uniref:golgin subfamily A member 6-like protein 2 n=1 Tax=Camponotus floridanus TaxID=104421 RepID=UPI000DC6BBDB|nr:golgin subfamily A member 6-like protein 2 [Camponotus floridanus]
MEELKQRLYKIERERGEGRKETEEEQKEMKKSNIEKGIETEIIRKGLEIWKEEEERQKRRKNIVIKGVDKKEKNVEETIKELWKVMEVSGKIEEIRELGKGNKREKRMILVKMENREDKIEIMRKKWKLRERNEKIQDDWTWKERSIQWNLDKIAWEERKKGKKAWVKYGKIWMNEKWWRWNEEEMKLEEGDEEEKRERRKEEREMRGIVRTEREVDRNAEKRE